MSAVAAVGVDGIPSTDDPDFDSFWIVRSVRLSPSKQSFFQNIRLFQASIFTKALRFRHV